MNVTKHLARRIVDVRLQQHQLRTPASRPAPAPLGTALAGPQPHNIGVTLGIALSRAITDPVSAELDRAELRQRRNNRRTRRSHRLTDRLFAASPHRRA